MRSDSRSPELAAVREMIVGVASAYGVSPIDMVSTNFTGSLYLFFASPSLSLPHPPSLCLTLPLFASPSLSLPHPPSLCLTLPLFASPSLSLPHPPSLCLTLPLFASPSLSLPHPPSLCLTLPLFASLSLSLRTMYCVNAVQSVCVVPYILV